MTGSSLRASDEDRRRAVTALEQHTAAGRLNLDEYADRVDRVLASRTHADLAGVLADLPAEAGPAPDQRHLLVAFGIATLVVVLFAIILAVARG
jgi:hypothetical protein